MTKKELLKYLGTTPQNMNLKVVSSSIDYLINEAIKNSGSEGNIDDTTPSSSDTINIKTFSILPQDFEGTVIFKKTDTYGTTPILLDNMSSGDTIKIKNSINYDNSLLNEIKQNDLQNGFIFNGQDNAGIKVSNLLLTTNSENYLQEEVKNSYLTIAPVFSSTEDANVYLNSSDSNNQTYFISDNFTSNYMIMLAYSLNSNDNPPILSNNDVNMGFIYCFDEQLIGTDNSAALPVSLSRGWNLINMSSNNEVITSPITDINNYISLDPSSEYVYGKSSIGKDEYELSGASKAALNIFEIDSNVAPKGFYSGRLGATGYTYDYISTLSDLVNKFDNSEIEG